MTQLKNKEIIKRALKSPTVSKAYDTHGVLYGDYLDVRYYKNVKITFNGTDTSKTRRKDGNKRNDSVARSKVFIYRLVTSNIRKHGRNFRPIFGTYTFEKSITDLDIALTHYRRYIRRLNNYTGKKIRYVAVPQIQWQRYKKTKQKVWHFHFVFFNLPKIDFDTNDKLWGQGYVNMQFIKKISDIGAYIAGYMTKKDFKEIPFNRRFYYCSTKLKRPKDFFHKSSIEKLLKNDKVKEVSEYKGASYKQIKYKLC